MVPVTRTEITVGASNAWTDVDVTAHLGDDAGDVAGVMLEIANNSGGMYWTGVRKNGSGDDTKGILAAGAHTWMAVGVDSSDIFEAYVGNTSTIDIYIVGYFQNSEATFLTNVTTKTPGTPGSWQEVDISGDTGGETALCALFFVKVVTANSIFGLKENGSTDDRKADLDPSHASLVSMDGAFMSVDEAEKLQCYVEDANLTLLLVGWITANFVSFTNAHSYAAAASGDWEEVDMGSHIPAGWDGAFLHFYPAVDSTYIGGIRKNGTEIDNYTKGRLWNHQLLWVEVDSDRKAEQKVNHTDLDLFLWGYTKQPSAPPPPAVKAIVQATLI